MSFPILVTGAAGFIGFHVAKTLLEKGEKVLAFDNLSPYYDVKLKEDRLKILKEFPQFIFHKVDISKKLEVENLWKQYHPKKVVHLAAQAGVRYSLEDPFTYIETNVMGHLILLEQARFEEDFQHFVYASTSSVYGLNEKLPFSIKDPTDSPISVYAATKKMDELLSGVYRYLFKVPATGLRFFTVYGPWGRPDMSAFIFLRKIIKGEPIPVFNDGKMARDYTYVNDIVSGILKVLEKPSYDSEGNPLHKVYNLGNSSKESLMRFISLIEENIGKKAQIEFLPMHPADVKETCADIKESQEDFGFDPVTSLEEGIKKLVAWYQDYYKASDL
ncbi:MAG: SDR family NAD(P)-dependent oxidoreductase [Proteobacteria bacterium]|nr:SDR family NAD(P)-dependent oxidoreductase [Pseudomonadota bacterium]